MQQEFVIRSARPEDAEPINVCVGDIRVDTYLNPKIGLDADWAEQLKADLLGPEELEECRDNIVRAEKYPERSLYLVVGGRVIDAVFYAEKHSGIQEIHRLFVAKSLRGKGLSSLFFERYKKWRDPDLPDNVTVVPYNKFAVDLYERRGFGIVPGSEHTYPDRVPTIVMRHPAGEMA